MKPGIEISALDRLKKKKKFYKLKKKAHKNVMK